MKKWGYLDAAFAAELANIYSDIHNHYLHSGAVGEMETEALRCTKAAYQLLNKFLGVPNDLMGIRDGAIACFNENDPRWNVFYLPNVRS